MTAVPNVPEEGIPSKRSLHIEIIEKGHTLNCHSNRKKAKKINTIDFTEIIHQ